MTNLSHARLRFYTAANVIVLALQAAGGLLIPGLYRDSTWVISAYHGTDITSLAIVIPLLIASHVLVQRGSLRAWFTWLGTVYYIFYMNMYYIFSVFNKFFLVYVAIFILSLFALVDGLINTDITAVEKQIMQKMPRRVIASLMIGLGAVLFVTWVGQSIQYMITSQVPKIITDTGSLTNAVAIWDLTLIVPPLVLGAVMLWRGRVWGCIVSAAMLVQCTIVCAALIISMPVQARAGVKDAWVMFPMMVSMEILFITAAILLFRSTGTPELLNGEKQ